MSSHQPQYSYSLPPDNVRLPSIKDLNFPPVQDGAPPNGSGRAEHPRQRHEPPPSWPRGHPPAPAPPQQHSQQHSQHPQHPSSMPPSHEPPPKAHPPHQPHQAHQPHPAHQYPPPSKADAPYATQGQLPPQHPMSVPPHNGGGSGTRSENPADAPPKRNRSQQVVGASQSRSTHPPPYQPYPSQPPPPQAYHQAPPPGAPPPQESMQPSPQYGQQPPPPPQGYSPYPPQPMPPRNYPMAPPPAPPAHHHTPAPPPSPYPPPPPPHQSAEHWQQPSPQQAPQQPPSAPPPPQPSTPQQQFNGYTRTTPLVPANVEPRTLNPSPTVAGNPNVHPDRAGVINTILGHCAILYSFAHHYAATHKQPSKEEIVHMDWRAGEVMRLMETLKRMDIGEEPVRGENPQASANPADEQPRGPKRPWEDMARESEPPATNGYDAQSTAEQDMQIIRNKRQSSTGGAAGAQQKNKYRKRSRATPPGKCHSCNIRETPEWRRGPDGARTLCNACGLHYAKLMRKRDKTLDANGKAPPIDLQTLRASTASARGASASGSGDHGGEPSHSQSHPPPHQAQPPQSPYESKPLPMHGGPPPQHPPPYPHVPQGSSGQPHHMMSAHGPPSAPHSAAGTAPPPPWLAASGPERGSYNETTYVRPSHPASHARASPQ